MRARLHPFSAGAALLVAQNLRQVDRDEVFATRYGSDAQELVDSVAVVPDFAWVATWGGKPVAVIGARPLWPKVWSVFAFGTDDWDRVAVTLTRHARRFMFPAIKESGAGRIICFSHSAHTQAHGWLRYLGANEEVPLPAWGRDGEDFIMFAWRR